MKILLCDDQQEVLDVVSALIEEEAPGTEIETYTSMDALEAALRASDGDADALFLDIVFQGREVIAQANRIHAAYQDLPIVFMTGYLRYAPDLFEAAPVALLAKPFRQERVAHALCAVEAHADHAQRVIRVRSRDGEHTIRLSVVEYIESNGRKLTIHGECGSVEYYGKLSEMEKILPGSFARCHQSFLVNLARVVTVGPQDVTLVSGSVLPVARRRRAAFTDAFAHYGAGAIPLEPM